jgi:hypothetical protein
MDARTPSINDRPMSISELLRISDVILARKATLRVCTPAPSVC